MNNPFCQCLHEIENKLPRTKFCFIACREQRMIMHERYKAELAAKGIEYKRGMVMDEITLGEFKPCVLNTDPISANNAENTTT